jgi:hypothetical protein
MGGCVWCQATELIDVASSPCFNLSRVSQFVSLLREVIPCPANHPLPSACSSLAGVNRLDIIAPSTPAAKGIRNNMLPQPESNVSPTC